MAEEKQSGWRWGVNRWIVLGLIILSVFTSQAYPPLQPHIQLPAENVSGPLFMLLGQPFYLTNTLVATLLADIILLLIGFSFWRSSRKSEGQALKGITGVIEGMVEVLYNLTESTAGKWAKTIFPFFATITLLVLVSNWMELIPGVDSIGVFDEHHIAEEAQCDITTYHVLGMELEAVVGGDSECSAGVVPFVRVASTDLNFTLAIAIFAVAGIQVVGLRAQGMGYLTKFWNTSTLFKVPMFGVIDFGVGLIELVSEFVKVLSFAFRLFGNIFAGSVMLFVIGSLVPVFAQSAFLMLEFFVGAIQAIVFGMLTMIFMSQATISHAHGDDH
ncbi:MAG: F0F1 ATP synthase subunit A [Chloroflexi bacterium]|nr:F0F1 ATP synthase subunit A [Chloroflexota bacterium]